MSAPEVQRIFDINQRRHATGLRLSVDSMVALYEKELRISERNADGKVTKSFIDGAFTVWDRALSVPDIQAVILREEEFNSASMFNTMTKLQSIISKAHSRENIEYCFYAFHDMHMANLMTTADLTRRRLEGLRASDNGKGLVELVILKRRTRY